MQWNDTPPVWKTCFELAWEAHLEGSNPIAALVADKDGNIVSTGKSAVKAKLSGVHTSHCEIAHAEINALLALDNRKHTKSKASEYTLFATLEPCPLCFSALYMSDVKHLAFAATDRYGGSTNLLGSTPYLSRKDVHIEGPYDTLGEISIFLNVYCDILRGDDVASIVHSEMAKDYKSIVELARNLAPHDKLGINRRGDFGSVYESIRNAVTG